MEPCAPYVAMTLTSCFALPQTGSALFLSDTVAFSPLRVNCTPPANGTPARPPVTPVGTTSPVSAPAPAAPAWSPRELAAAIEAARMQRIGGGWERARALQSLLSQCTGPVVPPPINQPLPSTPAGNSSSGSDGSGSAVAAVRIAFLSVRPVGMWLAAVQSATVSPSGALVAAAQGSAGGGGGGIKALQLLPGMPFNVSVQLYDDNNQTVTAGACAGYEGSGVRWCTAVYAVVWSRG